MGKDRLDRVKRVFDVALKKDAVERALYLEGIADSDPELRKEVESFLASDGEDSFFEKTPPCADSVANETAEKIAAIRPPADDKRMESFHHAPLRANKPVALTARRQNLTQEVYRPRR